MGGGEKDHGDDGLNSWLIKLKGEGSCIHSIMAAEIQALCCLPAGGDRCWLVSHNQV